MNSSNKDMPLSYSSRSHDNRDRLENLLDRVYQEYYGQVFRFVLLRVNNIATAQELAQETFTRLLSIAQKRPEQILRAEFNPKAYVYKIARNLIIDHYKARGRMKLTELSENLIDSAAQSQDQIIEIKLEVEQVVEFVSQLKPLWRDVITMREVDDLSLKEIGSIIGKSPGAVKVILHRARKKLRDMKSGLDE